MRLSEYFHLAESQPALDFVDIMVDEDFPIFIDPRPLRSMPGDWAQEAQFVLQSFFSEVLRALAAGADARVTELLAYLREPSEIHFGFTKKGFGGRGVGAANRGRPRVGTAAK